MTTINNIHIKSYTPTYSPSDFKEANPESINDSSEKSKSISLFMSSFATMADMMARISQLLAQIDQYKNLLYIAELKDNQQSYKIMMKSFESKYNKILATYEANRLKAFATIAGAAPGMAKVFSKNSGDVCDALSTSSGGVMKGGLDYYANDKEKKANMEGLDAEKSEYLSKNLDKLAAQMAKNLEDAQNMLKSFMESANQQIINMVKSVQQQ